MHHVWDNFRLRNLKNRKKMCPLKMLSELPNWVLRRSFLFNMLSCHKWKIIHFLNILRVAYCKNWSPAYIHECLSNKLCNQHDHRLRLICGWFVRKWVRWTVPAWTKWKTDRNTGTYLESHSKLNRGTKITCWVNIQENCKLKMWFGSK